MSESLQKIKDYKMQILRSLYNQCTEPQQVLFCRMYKSVDEIPEDRIDWAIQQCERTIEANKGKIDNDKGRKNRES